MQPMMAIFRPLRCPVRARMLSVVTGDRKACASQGHKTNSVLFSRNACCLEAREEDPLTERHARRRFKRDPRADTSHSSEPAQWTTAGAPRARRRPRALKQLEAAGHLARPFGDERTLPRMTS